MGHGRGLQLTSIVHHTSLATVLPSPFLVFDCFRRINHRQWNCWDQRGENLTKSLVVASSKWLIFNLRFPPSFQRTSSLIHYRTGRVFPSLGVDVFRWSGFTKPPRLFPFLAWTSGRTHFFTQTSRTDNFSLATWSPQRSIVWLQGIPHLQKHGWDMVSVTVKEACS